MFGFGSLSDTATKRGLSTPEADMYCFTADEAIWISSGVSASRYGPRTKRLLATKITMVDKLMMRRWQKAWPGKTQIVALYGLLLSLSKSLSLAC